MMVNIPIDSVGLISWGWWLHLRGEKGTLRESHIIRFFLKSNAGVKLEVMTCFFFSLHPGCIFFWFLGLLQRKTVAEIAFSPLQHFFSLSLYRHLLLSLITGDTFNNIWPSSFGSPRDVQLFALEETRRAMSHRWWTNSLNFGGGSEYFTYNYTALVMEEILHYTNW